MRILSLTLAAGAAGAALTLGACTDTRSASAPPASNASSAVRDTGSMAFPAPRAAGTIGTTSVGATGAPTDTGNMAFPAPRASGTIGTTSVGGSRTPTDTGNMAFPAPQPQGRLGTRPLE